MLNRKRFTLSVSWLLFFIILSILFLNLTDAQESRNKKKKRQNKQKLGTKVVNPQRAALEAWAASLNPELDYNSTQWRYMFRSRSASDYFDQYVKKLSKLFMNHNAIVNFAMVGACDGKTDPTIKYRFLTNDHWRGVFVEPMEMNVRDLSSFLEEKGGINRSYILKAAATDVCESPTITVERPLYEEKAALENKTVPHWLRRQIGSILPKHRDHARPDWTLEHVPCLTASKILSEWAKATSQTSEGKIIKRRPHVLKIDVEGHDFQVITSFISEKTPYSELPLLVEFEAKSISKKFSLAKEIMEAKGYIVSNYGADGFALLRGDKISPPSDASNKKSKKNFDKKIQQNTEDSEIEANSTEEDFSNY